MGRYIKLFPLDDEELISMRTGSHNFIIVTRKEEKHKLITKCIEILGNEITLNDLLSIESLSWNDRKELKSLFGEGCRYISSQDFFFEKKDGKWINENSGYKHRFTTKILNSFQSDQTCPIGSEVSPGDPKLIEILLEKWEGVREEEDGSGLPVDETIVKEQIEYISKDLKQTLGETVNLDYTFIKAFIESFHDFDEMLLERCIKKMDEEANN